MLFWIISNNTTAAHWAARLICNLNYLSLFQNYFSKSLLSKTNSQWLFLEPQTKLNYISLSKNLTQSFKAFKGILCQKVNCVLWSDLLFEQLRGKRPIKGCKQCLTRSVVKEPSQIYEEDIRFVTSCSSGLSDLAILEELDLLMV